MLWHRGATLVFGCICWLYVLELRVECSLAAHWGQNSMVCRLRRLAEPTSRWFQMFFSPGSGASQPRMPLVVTYLSRQKFIRTTTQITVFRMRMDRTHTYIIYYSIYNIIYIYMCVLFTYHISCTSCFYMYINCVKCLQPVLVFKKCRPCFHPACAGMHPVWWSAWTSMIVPFSQRGSGVGFVPPSMRVGGSGDTDHHRPAMPML